jgi:hypothetical protein
MFIENMNRIEFPDPRGVVYSPCNLVLNSAAEIKNIIPGLSFTFDPGGVANQSGIAVAINM